MGPLLLSIVIGTYRRESLLQKCLDALSAGVHVTHEIIVVDAGSRDRTLENIKRIPTLRLIKEDGLIGQAKSLNQVFKDLDSEYICWLSDDNIVEANVLDIAVECLQKNPDLGMIALKVRDVTGPHTESPYLGSIWESGILNCNQGMLSTKLMKRLGGFDEEFRDYGIDADLTTRVLLAGYKVVYTKSVAIRHYRNQGNDSWIAESERDKRLEDARALYRRKYRELITNGIRPGLIRKPPYSSIDRYYAGILLLIVKMTRSKRIEVLIKSHLRDRYNIANGRFISRWDLIENIFKPYYLVQEIPEPIREQIRTGVTVEQASRINVL